MLPYHTKTKRNEHCFSTIRYASLKFVFSLCVYFMRWKAYFDYLACVLDGKQPEELDFYTLEEAWTKETGFYSSIPEGNTVVVAKNIFEEVF